MKTVRLQDALKAGVRRGRLCAMVISYYFIGWLKFRVKVSRHISITFYAVRIYRCAC